MGDLPFLISSATTGAFAAGVLLAGNRYRAQIKADVRPFEGKLCFAFRSSHVDVAHILVHAVTTSQVFSWEFSS